MGLFGSSKKTYVSTSVSRVIEDGQIPEPHKSAMIDAIMTNKNIADTMLDSSLNSKVFDFERMYRYAERGDYFYGSPNAREVDEPAIVTEVGALLERRLGQSITVDYAKLDEALPKHFGYQTLYDSYKFNRITGEIKTLSEQKETPVYLKNLQSFVPVTSREDVDLSILQVEESTLPSYYGSMTPAEQNEALYDSLKNVTRVRTTEDFIYDLQPDAKLRVVVVYVWEEDEELKQDTFTVVLPDSTDNDPKQFYQVGYFVSPNDYRYWTYQHGSGTYPVLDIFFDVQYNKEGSYFPFAIFRRKFKNRTLDSYTETEEFKSTKRLLQYIDLDFKSLGDSIHENPDINDVIQAAMMMAVPMDTKNQIEARYLFDYFDRLRTTYTPVSINPNNDITANHTITWADADFSMSLSYNSVHKRTIQEAFGKIGDYKVDIKDHSTSYTRQETNNQGDTESAQYTKTYKSYEIKRQLGAGLCQVIIVINPVAKYDIDDLRSYESTKDNSILLIPLDYLITQRYTLAQRTELYYRSLHFVFNAKVVIKLKWYETSVFKFILLVVAVVITVYTGIDVATSIYSYLATLGLTGVVLVLATVLVFVGMQLAITYGFKLVVKELGTDLAMIIAVALIAYGSYKGFSGQMPTAQTYMTLGTNMMDASTYMLEQDMKAITQEGVELAALKTEQEAELEKAMELLENNNEFLDPFTFIGKKPIIIPSETPNSFYLRTIHQGNPARWFYKSIENYAEIMLTIPKGN